MDHLTQVLLLTTLAGAAIPIGAVLARLERICPWWLENEFRHSVIAFGGGTLLSAVSLVLVPDGVRNLSPGWVIVAFLSGGAAFWGLESLLARSKSSVAQLAAMLSDFIPEAIALGAAFATGEGSGMLLALLIGLQNLPEGFNAYRELKLKTPLSSKTIIAGFFLLIPLGPLAGVCGYFWLSPFPAAVGFIMLFAAGGILYLTFQDLAPDSRLKNRTAPAYGAVLGFLLGLIGQLVLHPS